jgi:hypothetical protein
VSPPIETADRGSHDGRPEQRSRTTDGRQDLYREDVYSDRKVGTIRVMTPVKSDGTPDPLRQPSYVGQAQIMTPGGLLPLSFEIPASSLREACDRFADAAQGGVR